MVEVPTWPRFSGPQIIDLKLDRIQKFLDKIGNPERNITNIIHVAGTNGKGSTISFMKTLFENAGYSVNCYTSPHLISFNERIRIKGGLISDKYLNKLSRFCDNICQENPDITLTFFEGTTILAILAFAENPADINIFETGMGGRLDATNIFQQVTAAVITPIAMDHQEFLGDNLADIASEKAGIIKSGSKVFIGKQNEEIYQILVEKSYEKSAQIFTYNHDFSYQKEGYIDNKLANIIKIGNLPLVGDHQKYNFTLALKVFFELTNYQNLNFSLSKLSWPGRITYLDNLPDKYSKLDVWVDGGHNKHAAQAIARWAKHNQIDHIIIAMNKSKNLSDYINEFRTIKASVYFTEMTIFKDCYKVTDIKQYSTFFKQQYHDPIIALDHIENGRVLICGSLYLIGEVMQRFGIKII